MAGVGARPPPMRLPSNLPALQHMGQQQQQAQGIAAASDPSKMGVGRGSLTGVSGPNMMNGGGGGMGTSNKALAASQLAAGGMAASASAVGGVLDGGGASINVYVGKLKAEVDNSMVQELLWCCGRVEKWNRAVDPSTDLPKAFGFCTYRGPQAAAISVQVG